MLAEHRVSASAAPVLGIVLDGLGMGENGELWGGEFLRADYRGFERLATFTPAVLIGGNRAMREPWRNAFAHLHQSIGWPELARRHPDLDIVRLIASRQPAVLMRMAESGLNAPLASSAGRLFDAAAAIIGIHPERVSYEGQAAIDMEALAAPMMAETAGGYPIERIAGTPLRLAWSPFWNGMIDDMHRGCSRAAMAARVHRGLIDALSSLATDLCRDHAIGRVVLAGGVMQNRLLLEGIAAELREAGLAALTPCRLPANDGGISAGQAAIAALR